MNQKMDGMNMAKLADGPDHIFIKKISNPRNWNCSFFFLDIKVSQQYYTGIMKKIIALVLGNGMWIGRNKWGSNVCNGGSGRMVGAMILDSTSQVNQKNIFGKLKRKTGFFSYVFWPIFSPGPLAPPLRSRPSLNITALSYSCTTLAIQNDDCDENFK